jgi:hypothetical protein
VADCCRPPGPLPRIGSSGTSRCGGSAEAESLAFLEADREALDFPSPVIECDPPDISHILQREEENAVDVGIFEWALQRPQAVVVPARYAKGSVRLHVLATRAGVVGMFAGPDPKAFVRDATQKLVTILLMHCANMLESARLWADLEALTRNLEGTVRDRTRELESAKQARAGGHRAKSEFLATTSHGCPPVAPFPEHRGGGHRPGDSRGEVAGYVSALHAGRFVDDRRPLLDGWARAAIRARRGSRNPDLRRLKATGGLSFAASSHLRFHVAVFPPLRLHPADLLALCGSHWP